MDKDPVTWIDREDKRATDLLVEEDVSTTALEVTTTVFSLDSEDETGINSDSELEKRLDSMQQKVNNYIPSRNKD